MDRNNRSRSGPFAGLSQGAADLAAAAHRYGDEWGGNLGRQVLEAAKQAARAHQQGQRIHGQGLMAASRAQARPSPVVRSVAGKVVAAPYTAAGALFAVPEALATIAQGRTPKFRIGDNALQFLNAPLPVNRALTLGNMQFYPPGRGPDEIEPSYSGATMRIGDHEAGHSDAMEEDILYGPKWLFGGGWRDDRNPLELDADRRGLERARRRKR